MSPKSSFLQSKCKEELRSMYAGVFDLGLGWECEMNVFVLEMICRIT